MFFLVVILWYVTLFIVNEKLYKSLQLLTSFDNGLVELFLRSLFQLSKSTWICTSFICQKILFFRKIHPICNSFKNLKSHFFIGFLLILNSKCSENVSKFVAWVFFNRCWIPGRWISSLVATEAFSTTK